MLGAYSGQGIAVMVSPDLLLGWRFQFMHTLRTCKAMSAACGTPYPPEEASLLHVKH